MAKETVAPSAPRLKALYKNTIAKELQAELKLDNINQVPKLEKIVVSVGTGKKKDDKRHLETVKNTLTKVTGQAPVEKLAKKSIAGFKIRAGMGSPIGVMVTLRDGRAYEFLDRLANVDLPRVRDFHGVSAKGFDKSGNFNLGITDQSVFPELTFEETQIIHGLQVTIVISGGSPANSRALLEKFGIPFEKQGGAA
ncbi:50S ribosomal protein L5 [Candidatus Saccharibacteria bacterium]|nr:50S ribosomal protein L5 [Candidatus Saccharibacteria bacterium]MBP9985916.1 50S ribosomal protein L5 [Candidatus Saccharibacteria bacterium]